MLDKNICNFANAANGKFDVILWLHKVCWKESCTTKAMDGAAAGGHLDILKLLHYERAEGCTANAMDRAAGNGHLDIVKSLYENRTEDCTTDAMDSATSIEVIDFLYENRTEGFTNDAFYDIEGADGDL